MLPIDLVITVVFIGVFHLGIGVLIGRNLKRTDEPARQSTVLWGLHEATANKDLTVQLNSLAQLRERLASTPDSDVTERLRSLVEQFAQIVQRSQGTITAANARKVDEPAATDAVSLAREKWFPVTAPEAPHDGKELRKARRFPYLHRQDIAPTLDGGLPNASSFVKVLFRDIYPDGFSFYSPKEFPAEQLVAKLGTPPDIVPVLARVAHQKEVWHDGAWVFHVGCKILRRLDNETALPAPSSAEHENRVLDAHYPRHSAAQRQAV